MDIIVNVLPDCKAAVISGGEPNDVVKYDISLNKEVVITPPSFLTSFTYCTNLLSYSLIDLENRNITADPLVFTLIPGPIIKLQTSDKNKVRNYRLGLVALVLSVNKTAILTV